MYNMGEESQNKSENIFLTSLANRSEGNFFASANNKIEWEFDKIEYPKQKLQGVRINDYDSTILENNAYQTISDELFKIEHKIDMLEQSLSKLNNEIETLQTFGESIQISNLKERKNKIEQELKELNQKYSQFGLGAKISNQIAIAVNLSGKNLNAVSKIKKFITKEVLAKISKKFNYSQSMTEALENLSNINASVDELINMQTPYGENINRYEKLTAYLNKANVLHSQINRNVNKLTNNTQKSS